MKKELFWMWIGIALLFGMNLAKLLDFVTGITYKDGQVDAINGTIKYKLVVNKDKTSQWETITK